ncbi:MAG: hypothetical protein AAGK80_04935 [Pseudomonadota bacterium]
MTEATFLRTISDPSKVITPIDSTIRFPEVLDILVEKYDDAINVFCELIEQSDSSAEVLEKIRSSERPADQRMSLLKMYRRCVSPVLDTEMTKKIRKVSTESLVETYGETFKPIKKLKTQFSNLPKEMRFALAALVGEYDTRGQLGYQLTGAFFDWFEETFEQTYRIEGPRGAGRDIELSTILPDYRGNFPCDFVIRRTEDNAPLAIGFARYDSTRGGAQSDDRTGGNSDKVNKMKAYHTASGKLIKLVFLSDGPGLIHNDTWEEACILDDVWDDNVRVTTLKLAGKRITTDWLES